MFRVRAGSFLFLLAAYSLRASLAWAQSQPKDDHLVPVGNYLTSYPGSNMAFLTGIVNDLRKLATSPSDQKLAQELLSDVEYLRNKLLTQ
ncbi:hypothetical protein E5K00_17955 [Hymenobacter aquaticus]|uniref:Uncharacterized protein n=1 Tax=Hymenobacter aquaticus TaxID=1867101 RepID=A0A4Z0PXE0_9BACT|nr:hypothetical protein [Hymenobacter aquaticus]TGE22135.1 hypothetical protein E5K00_17955 [Hymenobacter aquaticus]